MFEHRRALLVRWVGTKIINEYVFLSLTILQLTNT